MVKSTYAAEFERQYERQNEIIRGYIKRHPEALTRLDKRRRVVLIRRGLGIDGQRALLQTLADEFGVSRERIRQIESDAHYKMLRWAAAVEEV